MTEFVESGGIYVEYTNAGNSPASVVSICKRWNAGGNSTNMGQKAAISSRGGSAIRISFGGSLFKTLSPRSTWITGMRAAVNSVAGVGGGVLHAWYATNNAGQVVQIAALKVRDDGSLLLYTNSDQTKVIASSAIVLTASTFGFIEYKIVITGTTDLNVAGTIWVDNVQVAIGNSNSAIDGTQMIHGATANRMELSSGVATNGGATIHDMYVNNTVGTTNILRFGPVEIDPLFPDGDTGLIQWTPSTGLPNFALIDENPADETDYVGASLAPKLDTYSWENVPAFVGTVKGVQISYLSRQTDEGPKLYCQTIGALGTEAVSQNFAPGFTFQYMHESFDIDPATALAWTQAGYNAKPFGISLVS